MKVLVLLFRQVLELYPPFPLEGEWQDKSELLSFPLWMKKRTKGSLPFLSPTFFFSWKLFWGSICSMVWPYAMISVTYCRCHYRVFSPCLQPFSFAFRQEPLWGRVEGGLEWLYSEQHCLFCLART